jgi:hypothetical protein
MHLPAASFYLVGVLDAPETRSGIDDIGAETEWSHESLPDVTAEQRGERIRIVPVPVTSPEPPSHWLRSTTGVEYATARPLVESTPSPVTVDPGRDLQDVVPVERTPVEEAIQQALAE